MIFEKGQIISNRYKTLEILGEGSIGEVYIANDLTLNRKVTIKVFKSSSDLSTARIQREAELLSKLRHPNIIAIYDAGLFNSSYYFILEYVDGTPLITKLKSELLSFKNIVNYSTNIANALEHIHSKQIIHRDIKPSNILINNDQNIAYLTDFSISKYLSIDDETFMITREDSLIGTIAYMSPEQYRNSFLTSKADIYSFGLIMVEMFIGQLPFKTDNLFEITEGKKNSSNITTIILNVRPKIPTQIIEIIKRMLSQQASERPSATEVLEVLSNINTDEPYDEKINLDKTKIKSNFDDSSLAKSQSFVSYTNVMDKSEVKGTGFFANEDSRYNEFLKSVEFYRSHLNKDYNTLLSQARIAFWLWVSMVTVGFIIIAFSTILLIMGKWLEGSISIISETFIYFIQKAFQVREDYYRKQADKKSEHLELGNYWNLSVQSIDAISDPSKKENKLIQLIDSLNARISEKKII